MAFLSPAEPRCLVCHFVLALFLCSVKRDTLGSRVPWKVLDRRVQHVQFLDLAHELGC